MDDQRVEFGVRLPIQGPLSGPGAIVQVARRAEQLGFDAVWVSDFIDWNRNQDRFHLSSGSTEIIGPEQVPVYYESLTTLSFLAGLTQRVRLGIAVLCLPYRNPLVTARQLTNIDVYSGGRLIVGIGPGGSKSGHNRNFEVLGVPRPRKFERMVDYFRAIRCLWTEPVSEYQGEFISFPPVEFYPKPVQKPHPPVWGGGWTQTSLEVVAQFCDGWIPGWVTPEEYPAYIERLYDMARARGRDGVRFTIATEIFAIVDRTHEGAYEKSKATFAALPLGFQTNPPEEKIRRSSLVGSVEEVQEQVRRFVEAGVRHFELKFIYHSIEHLLEQMELFGREIIPMFR